MTYLLPSQDLPQSNSKGQVLHSSLTWTFRWAGELHKSLTEQALGTHEYGVAWVAYRLATAADLLDETLSAEQVLLAGCLHDIGKHTLPSGILEKAGTLSESERYIVMTHPMKAYMLLQTQSELDDTVLQAVLHHHERYDGMGYPVGQSGQGIPLLARILSLADVYHALISDRPYRPAYSHTYAVQFILDQRGHAFDPYLATLFVDEVIRNT